jgi:hypothetical protein
MQIAACTWQLEILSVACAQKNGRLIAFETAEPPCRDGLFGVIRLRALSVDRLKRLLDGRRRNPKQAGIGLG